MARASKADKEFKIYAGRQGAALDDLTPAAAIASMGAFYRDVRFPDCDVEQDGDMLLFQWGSYDWGQGLHFELDITRQLISEPGDDENIRQLSIAFRFAPDDEFRSLGSGNHGCSRPTGVEAFLRLVVTQPCYLEAARKPFRNYDMRFEVAG